MDRSLFWKLVEIKDEESCWSWLGDTNSDGYGRFSDNGHIILAHRYSYECEKGSIPPGLVVCHKCDNPICCNPHHLFLGTVRDNNVDKQLKGRQSSGENNGRAKLTWEKVDEIRRRHAAGESNTIKLAREYGVHKRTIQDIVWGAKWKR